MSLPHALLTSLAERPGSGSELANRFDRSIGYFWQATHQQIYRELARLEARGWIRSVAVEGARGRKRRYDVLPEGRSELARWTGADLEPPAIRDELMVRLRAEAVLGSLEFGVGVLGVPRVRVSGRAGGGGVCAGGRREEPDVHRIGLRGLERQQDAA